MYIAYFSSYFVCSFLFPASRWTIDDTIGKSMWSDVLEYASHSCDGCTVVRSISSWMHYNFKLSVSFDCITRLIQYLRKTATAGNWLTQHRRKHLQWNIILDSRVMLVTMGLHGGPVNQQTLAATPALANILSYIPLVQTIDWRCIVAWN